MRAARTGYHGPSLQEYYVFSCSLPGIGRSLGYATLDSSWPVASFFGCFPSSFTHLQASHIRLFDSEYYVFFISMLHCFRLTVSDLSTFGLRWFARLQVIALNQANWPTLSALRASSRLCSAFGLRSLDLVLVSLVLVAARFGGSPHPAVG